MHSQYLFSLPLFPFNSFIPEIDFVSKFSFFSPHPVSSSIFALLCNLSLLIRPCRLSYCMAAFYKQIHSSCIYSCTVHCANISQSLATNRIFKPPCYQQHAEVQHEISFWPTWTENENSKTTCRLCCDILQFNKSFKSTKDINESVTWNL